MHQLSRRKFIINILTGIGAIGFGYTLPKALAKEKIFWGAVLPLTGANALYAKGIHAALEIAINQVNEKGGINNIPVDLIVEDNKSNINNSIEMAKKLIEVDKVSFLSGFNHIFGMSQLACNYNIIFANYGLNIIPMEKVCNTYFTTNITMGQATKACTEWAASQNFGKAWSLATDKTYESSLIKPHFFEAAKRYGAKVKSQLEVSSKEDIDVLFSSKRIFKGSPSVIFANFIDYEWQNRFVMLAREYKVTNSYNVILILGSPLSGADLIGSSYRDIYVGIPWHWKIEDRNKIAQKFLEIFLKKEDQIPNWQHAVAYETTRMILDVAANLGTVATNKLIDYLEVAKYNSLRGKGEMRKEDHVSVSNYFILRGKIAERPKDMFDIAGIIYAVCKPRKCR